MRKINSRGSKAARRLLHECGKKGAKEKYRNKCIPEGSSRSRVTKGLPKFASITVQAFVDGHVNRGHEEPIIVKNAYSKANQLKNNNNIYF